MKTLNNFFCFALLLILLLPYGAFAQAAKQPPKQTGKQPAQPSAQQPGQQEEETDYTEEEYDIFEKAVNEPDLTKREDLLIKFLKDGHKTVTLNEYIVAAYLRLYDEYKTKGDNQKLAAAADKFLQQVPRDLLRSIDQEAQKTKKPAYAENAYLISLGMAVEAYQKLGNDKKFVELGETFYAEKPNPVTAYYLTKAYEKLKDTPRFVAWAEKTLKQNPTPEIALELSLELKNRYVEQHKLDLAARYGQNAIKLLETAKKPENVSPEEWRKFVEQNRADIYALLGETAYNKNSFSEAISNYEQALKYNRCKDAIYYRLAFANWKKDPPNINIAMLNFAKSERLGGRTSEESKKQLEHLYKPLHNNTLVGIDKVYQKADAELRGCKK